MCLALWKALRWCPPRLYSQENRQTKVNTKHGVMKEYEISRHVAVNTGDNVSEGRWVSGAAIIPCKLGHRV